MSRIDPKRVARFPHAEADQCVACGLCLPLCPTYRVTKDENDSPRGRIALIRALAKRQLDADDALISYLNRCTLCRACESGCPAAVGFEALMNRARTWLQQEELGPSSIVHTYLLNTLKGGHEQTRRFGQIARAYQRNPLRRALRGSGLLRGTLGQMDQQLPEFSETLEMQRLYPATGNKRGDVAFFHGCLQNQTDTETLSSSVTLLTALGFDVHVPPQQVCCGGLHLHSGKREDALDLGRKNVLAFHEFDAVIGAASGCGAVLKDYGTMLGDHDASGFGSKYCDINSFIAGLDWPDDIELAPLSGLALVHEPCSHRNQLGQTDLVYQLARRIPSLRVEALPENQFCCGGAGTYALTEPDLARQLREPKLQAIAQSRPDYLITTNIGCALHLKAGLGDYDVDTEIVHPMTLLARQLEQARQTQAATCA